MYGESLEDSRWTTVTKKKRTKKKGGEVEAPEESNENSLNQPSELTVNGQSKESSVLNGDVMSAPRTEETSALVTQEMTKIHPQIRNEQEFSRHEEITSRQQPIAGCLAGASDPLVKKTTSRPPIPPQQDEPKAKDLNAQAVKINNFNNKMSVSHPPSEPSTVPQLMDPVVADEDDGWETVVRKKWREQKRSKKESGPNLVHPQESMPNLAEDVLKDCSGFQNTEMNSTSGSSESARKPEKKAKKNKQKRKGKLNVPSAEIVEIIKEIITNIGAEKVTQAKLCTQLEAITGCTWNKPKHGQMRQFLEQNGFDIDASRPNQLMIGLSSQVPKELAESKPTTLTPPINNSKSRRRRKIKPKPPLRKKPPSHTKLPEFHKTSWLKTVGVVAVGCISAAVVIFGASSIR